MNLEKLINKILKIKRKRERAQTSPKLIIGFGLGIMATMALLISTKSREKLFKDLKKKDMPDTNDLKEIVQVAKDTADNIKDCLENKASEVKEEAVDLKSSIEDATREVKEDINKTTEVLYNEDDPLKCPIKEIISD